QCVDRRARSRRLALARQRLSLSAVSKDRNTRRAGRAGVTLYSDVIRNRFRNPRFRGTLANADVAFEDVNPLCGDRIRIECRLADGKIAEARFTGDCCAIAAASADVLMELMTGQPVTMAHTLGAGDLLERLDADIRPSRMKCVTLPLSVLQGALDGKEVAR